MDEHEQIEQIKKRLAENAYFINKLSDANAPQDLEILLSLLKKKDERIAQLEKKSSLLSQQVQELTTEIENVKGDFGNFR